MTRVVSFMAIFLTFVIFILNLYIKISNENNCIFFSSNTPSEWGFQVPQISFQGLYIPEI